MQKTKQEYINKVNELNCQTPNLKCKLATLFDGDLAIEVSDVNKASILKEMPSSQGYKFTITNIGGGLVEMQRTKQEYIQQVNRYNCLYPKLQCKLGTLSNGHLAIGTKNADKTSTLKEIFRMQGLQGYNFH
tara:strand:- start:7436 stop:7831 length:396 start_codon:yes stop_codon:yes gene_type:complete